MQCLLFLPGNSSNGRGVVVCQVFSLQFGSCLGVMADILMRYSLQSCSMFPPSSSYLIVLGVFRVNQTTISRKRFLLQKEVVQYNPTQRYLPHYLWSEYDGGAKYPEDCHQQTEGFLYDTSCPGKALAEDPFVNMLSLVCVGLHHPHLES